MTPSACGKSCLNIAGNAIKFTPQGSVLVRVEPGARENHVCFTIADTGYGIPDSEREAIFERFVQSSVTKFQPSGGTGLGLAISRDLVELMDGSIAVESELGEGTTFTVNVWLPPVTEGIVEDDVRAVTQCTAVLTSPEGATRTVLQEYLSGFGADLLHFCRVPRWSDTDRYRPGRRAGCRANIGVTGSGSSQKPGPGFQDWRKSCRKSPTSGSC